MPPPIHEFTPVDRLPVHELSAVTAIVYDLSTGDKYRDNWCWNPLEPKDANVIGWLVRLLQFPRPLALVSDIVYPNL
jgi:hypothetical protein